MAHDDPGRDAFGERVLAFPALHQFLNEPVPAALSRQRFPVGRHPAL